MPLVTVMSQVSRGLASRYFDRAVVLPIWLAPVMKTGLPDSRARSQYLPMEREVSVETQPDLDRLGACGVLAQRGDGCRHWLRHGEGPCRIAGVHIGSGGDLAEGIARDSGGGPERGQRESFRLRVVICPEEFAAFGGGQVGGVFSQDFWVMFQGWLCMGLVWGLGWDGWRGASGCPAGDRWSRRRRRLRAGRVEDHPRRSPTDPRWRLPDRWRRWRPGPAGSRSRA